MGPFSDRQRAAMERFHGYTRAGFLRVVRMSRDIDVAAAHDIALDALIRASRRHDDIHVNFYFRCLKLAFIDWARSSSGRNPYGRRGNRRPWNEAVEFDPGQHGGGWDGGFEAVEIRDECASALGKMAPLQRDILKLRCFEGLSDSDIARRLGVSKSAVYDQRRAAVRPTTDRGAPMPQRHEHAAADLTPRQVAVLEYACRSLAERDFVPPVPEIAAALDCSTETVLREYRKLAALGYAALNRFGVRMYVPVRTPDGRPLAKPRTGKLLGAAS